MELDGTRWIYRQVIDNGGIRRHTKDYLNKEYEISVPLHYRRKNGLPGDEMAMELGYDTEDELYQEIEKAERRRQSMTNNLPTGNYRLKDFLDAAKLDLVEELNPNLA